MDPYTIGEEAFKNGYEKGSKDAIKKFVEEFKKQTISIYEYSSREALFCICLAEKIAKDFVVEVKK